MKSSRDRHVLDQMGSALEHGNLAQSLLISGGAEILDVAVEEIRRALLCEGSRQRDCHCRSCETAVANHPDVVIVSPESRSIGREQVAEAVRGLAVRPLWSSAKVVIIRPAESLSREAESYLLKHLEEPPAYGYYLLASEQPEALLKTIRSRCQHWRFTHEAPDETVAGPISITPVTLEHLVELTYGVRQQYLASGDRNWLQLWETLQLGYQNLESNANPDLVLNAIEAVWLREGQRMA
ncbi:MAG: hypothetical protein OWU33_14220 [Firmicutes bacterium]|nr:hypothetical protein [Bacillota bacterium]